ncbi:hypothetical protein Tco_0247877 [Tanacetum coccineum]
MSSSEVDLNAADKSFIKVLSDDDSNDSDGDTNPFSWHAFAAREIVPTGFGDVNALYFTDKSSKYFTHLREILHLLNRQDLSKLYGMVVKHYEANPIAGAGMMLWGDLHVLFESVEGDTPYPILASTMKKMLKHKLEVEINGIGNDMTHAEQLIAFIKNRLAAYADFLVAASKYMTVAFEDGFQDVAVQSSVPAGSVVPTGKDNSIVSTGSTKVIPAVLYNLNRRKDLSRAGPTSGIRAWREPLLKKLYFYFTMTSQNPSQTYPMPSPSVSSFTFPSTTEPVFSASTSEPVFESPNHTQPSQTTQSQQLQQYHTTTDRYPVDTSLIHIESRKSPTAVLFDDDTGRISILHCEY